MSDGYIEFFEGMPRHNAINSFTMLALAYTDTGTANGGSMKKLPPFCSGLGCISASRMPKAIPQEQGATAD